MGTLRDIKEWSVSHNPKWLVVLRVALGFCLFAKGIVFMSNTVMLEELLQGSPMADNAGMLSIAITWANLLAGFLLIVGLFTRWVALIQIPILAGALVFINSQKSGFAAGSEWGLALVVLLLLIFFLIVGSGPLSLDHYFYINRGRQSRGTNVI